MASEMIFEGFVSIENFHNVVKRFTRQSENYSSFEVEFVPKIKLHGTNAGFVVFKTQTVVPMSRTRFLTEKLDNYGWAKWVNKRSANLFQVSGKVFEEFPDAESFTVWGEWCGKGIQKGVAISRLNRNVFCPFEVIIGNKHVWDPEKIKKFVPESDDLIVIDVESFRLRFDFVTLEANVPDASHVDLEELNARVAEIDALDPWVKKRFGLEGTGEGLVLYPVSGNVVSKIGNREFLDYSQLRNAFIFKAKGESHRVANYSIPVQKEVEKVSVDAFSSKFLTRERFQQALESLGEPITLALLGRFLKWITNDIEKESRDDLIASSLSWKDVRKSVTENARKMFVKEL